MRTIFVAASTALAIAAAPAPAAIMTLGTYAHSCYQAAESRDTSIRAFDACNRALAEEGLAGRDLVGTYVNRGVLWLVKGDFRRAHTDLDTALRLDPNEPEAWLNKAVAEAKAGNAQAAVRYADKALALGTRKPAIAHFVRGMAFEDSGNIRGAYAEFVRARDLAPRWHEPRLELARYRRR